MSEGEFELVEGSGNVFRDVAEPDADLKQAKAIVAAADFSRIRSASLGWFTLDRLMKVLAALDGRIRVTVHVAPRRTEGSGRAVAGLSGPGVAERLVDVPAVRIPAASASMRVSRSGSSILLT